ncbi:MAG: acetyl-CoA carboxylase, biotin carboxyl carrier protein, partial [Acidimicrobiia bacterium]|nr:acetyl-CoA carboxylase, biotin carboxyl carrier protein [Acidimicrobiia bacterium]
MDFDEIKQILEMMREHELSEFELERDNFKLRIQKQGSGHWVAAAPHAPAAPSTHAPAAGVPPA